MAGNSPAGLNRMYVREFAMALDCEGKRSNTLKLGRGRQSAQVFAAPEELAFRGSVPHGGDADQLSPAALSAAAAGLDLSVEAR
jgi:hypothetical protein